MGTGHVSVFVVLSFWFCVDSLLCYAISLLPNSFESSVDACLIDPSVGANIDVGEEKVMPERQQTYSKMVANLFQNGIKMYQSRVKM